jgi:hypothetical protein
MNESEMSDREKMVFQTGLFDDLTVQDSFTIIAQRGYRQDHGYSKQRCIIFRRAFSNA